ncbi:hypothetical protein B0T19DRAFT_398095 [Cercophora scortea]|uniref:Uncharacterized protein n=1 Tax=Cercophora scortea TaxID=314031 RepID=A0AAE0MIH9_9PEZI|nr:hypothetical protein B0T19DRAFT_398095 [Cercophora scortea]
METRRTIQTSRVKIIYHKPGYDVRPLLRSETAVGENDNIFISPYAASSPLSLENYQKAFHMKEPRRDLGDEYCILSLEILLTTTTTTTAAATTATTVPRCTQCSVDHRFCHLYTQPLPNPVERDQLSPVQTWELPIKEDNDRPDLRAVHILSQTNELRKIEAQLSENKERKRLVELELEKAKLDLKSVSEHIQSRVHQNQCRANKNPHFFAHMIPGSGDRPQRQPRACLADL